MFFITVTLEAWSVMKTFMTCFTFIRKVIIMMLLVFLQLFFCGSLKLAARIVTCQFCSVMLLKVQGQVPLPMKPLSAICGHTLMWRLFFYALFYVFLIHFQNGMSNCTYHNWMSFPHGHTYAWSGLRLVQTFCYKYHTSVGYGHIDGVHSASE